MAIDFLFIGVVMIIDNVDTFDVESVFLTEKAIAHVALKVDSIEDLVLLNHQDENCFLGSLILDNKEVNAAVRQVMVDCKNTGVLLSIILDTGTDHSYVVCEIALEEMVSRCQTLDALYLLYLALGIPDAGVNEDWHGRVVEAMIGKCQSDNKKLWDLYKICRNFPKYYRNMITNEINRGS